MKISEQRRYDFRYELLSSIIKKKKKKKIALRLLVKCIAKKQDKNNCNNKFNEIQRVDKII